MQVRRTPWASPYTDDGRTRFPVRGRPGVYLIRPASFLWGEPVVYVGHSTVDVYKALYRHFQVWNDSTRSREKRVTYPRSGYEVRILWTRTPQQAVELEAAFILRLQPRDNPDKLKEYTLAPPGKRMIEQANNAPTVAEDEPPF